MISLEFDPGDIDSIVQTARSITGSPELGKLSGFRLTDDGSLVFDQSIKLKTTVRLGLSCDASGRLLIEILQLMDSRFGNSMIKTGIELGSLVSESFGGKEISLADIAANSSKGLLVKVSDDVLAFDPSDLPFLQKAKLNVLFRTVEIRDSKLFVQAELR